MKLIPFYANRKDDMSCMLACYRSALEYLTDKPYSWEELEQLTGYQANTAAWSIKIWTYLATQGFDIRMIEGFDYKRYFRDGQSYLESFFTPTELAWQLKHTNLLEIQPLLPEFIERVAQEVRSPQLADIDMMLSEGYLVTVQLNGDDLNNKEGYTAHMILVYGKDADSYIAHDPGLPPKEARRISGGKLLAAMGGDKNTVEVTGLRLHTV